MKRWMQPTLITASLALAAGTAQAANITVDAGGACTLADAITAANSDTATGGCTAGSSADTITLQKDITLAAALPQITSVITIEGGGHFISGNNNASVGRVLYVTSSGNLTVNHATIKGGNTAGYGGGIFNEGTVTLTNCTVSGNSASFGGGISNKGTLTLTNSTASGNSASFGGGIENYSGTATLINSTVSGNTSSDGGGGIANLASLILKSCLISGNSALFEKELFNSGTITAASYNVFGHSDETSAEAFSAFTPSASDVVATSDGTAPAVLSAILSPPAYNGGFAQTHALPAGSPAIDLGAAACPNNLVADQREYTRPINFKCDAGAVEYSPSFSIESGNGRDLSASTWRMTAPSCEPLPADLSVQYGSDISGGVYGTHWVGYRWDVPTQKYAVMPSTTPLQPGDGHWVYSTIPTTLTVTGTTTPTEPCSNYGSGLSGNCFAVTLTPPAGAGSWQMVGHPLPYRVSWADVRVASSPDGSTWTQRTPTQAKAANIMEKEQWRWSGSAYESKDDATTGLIGTLQPQEAVWVRTLPSSVGKTVKLLVPAR